MLYVVRIGTIDELTGQGEEWLVDRETKQYVLAKFFNGNFAASSVVVPTESVSNEVTKKAA